MRRVYARFRALVDWIITLELRVAVVLFSLTGVVIAAEIFARRVLNLPFVWAEDLTVFLFVWTAFLGAAVLYDRNAALSIDSLVRRLRRARRSASALSWTLCSSRRCSISLGSPTTSSPSRRAWATSRGGYRDSELHDDAGCTARRDDNVCLDPDSAV